MTSPARLATALRAHAQGLYCLEAAAELLISQSWLHRADFTSQFVHLQRGLPGGPEMAAVDWPAVITALGASLPCSDLLTELPDVAAAQEARPSPRPFVEVSERSRLPGRGSHVASLTATETGHTVLNHLSSLSSLPIFDVSLGRPRGPVQSP